jgi:hypothetical protein
METVVYQLPGVLRDSSDWLGSGDLARNRGPKDGWEFV